MLEDELQRREYSIHNSSSNCLEAFERFRSYIKQSDPLPEFIPLPAIEDQIGRFRAWISNIGALKTDRSSLDFRLRDVTFLADNVVKLLETLSNTLSEVELLTEGEASQATSPEEDYYNDDESNSSSDSFESEEPSSPLTEIQQSYLLIVDVIDRLYKLPVIIKSPQLQNRSTKADNFIERDEKGRDFTAEFEAYAIERAKYQMRAWKKVTNEMGLEKDDEDLAIRLGKANSRRRRQFMYDQRHHLKFVSIQGAKKEEQNKESLGATRYPSSLIAKSPEFPASFSKSPASSNITTMTSETNESKQRQQVEDISDNSSTSSNSTTYGGYQTSNIIIPEPPENEFGKEFQCPYCYMILAAKMGKSEAWRNHVWKDLQPYMCIFKGCSTQDILYDSQGAWLKHEQWEHAYQWCCNSEGHPLAMFSDEKGFKKHLEKHHPETFETHQLQALADACKRPSLAAFSICPFCGAAPDNLMKSDYDISVDLDTHMINERANIKTRDSRFVTSEAVENLQRHVASHLRQSAIMALPSRDDLDYSKSTPDTGHRQSKSDIFDIVGTEIDETEPSPFVETCEMSADVPFKEYALLRQEDFAQIPGDRRGGDLNMQEEKSKPKSYALLIGINLYQQLSLIGAYENRSLKGCVRDIQEIKKYLENIPHVKHIQMLTASVPDEHFSPSANLFHPIEEPELWPTYENVISSLDYINSSAKPGDSVYIHFSGHGTSKGPTEPWMLVLFDRASNRGVRYLCGSELTQLLSNMVDKKLMVTLVLDCCQSGGVMRNDSSIRFLEYDPLVDAAYPSSHVQYLNPTYRHIATSYDTLRNPNGYTIITASGPHEKAQEYDFSKNEQYHGALSYFLLKAWKESGGPAVKQQLIYQYLSTRVRNTCQGQNPMCYGANNQGFFGGVLTEINQTSILVVRKPDKSIQLQAGHIHGICDGDQFSLYPFGDINPESGEPTIAKVIHVRTLVSDLKLLNIASTQVRTGWVATPLTRLSLRKFPIRIQLSAPYPDDWETARKERQSLNIIDMNQTLEQPTSFLVIQNNETENGYEIRDESSIIIKQPITTHHKRGDPNHILDIIEHIARFKLVKNMVNEALADQTHPFRESFNIKLTNSIGKDFYPGCSQTGWFQPGCSHLECSVEVKDGGKLYLHVDNKGDYDLYIYIYSLGPFWDVESALRANHIVIPSSLTKNITRDWKKGLKIKAPDDIKCQGQYQYEEVLKVFFTTRLTSFALLELPELGKPMKGGRPCTDRATGGDGPPENWAAVNFRIRVSSK